MLGQAFYGQGGGYGGNAKASGNDPQGPIKPQLPGGQAMRLLPRAEGNALVPVSRAAVRPTTDDALVDLPLTEEEFDKAFLKGFNYDIMQEIRENYSDKLKEELRSGRAGEETKEEFLRRAVAEGYATYDRAEQCYGFR